ncbi:hypothetical protein ACFOWX_00860 [Sphingorhabdus arenilitoris]|uniref:Uncharacterized protein n=1 Tax=Sphingorhabdus arenilitoris TaxID=1490041 RepID=A0ABV8RC59_9SPHN
MMFQFRIFGFMAAAAVSLIALGGGARASEPTLPAGWTKQENDTNIQYSNADGSSLVLHGLSTDTNVTILSAASTLDKPNACEGLTAQPVQKSARGVEKISLLTGTIKCAVYIGKGDGPTKMVLAIYKTDAAALRIAEAITNGWAQPGAQSASAAGSGGAETAVSDAQLAAYLARVPVSRRPVAVATRSSGVYGNFSIAVYLFFANGYAANCSDWDPVILEPTPESLGRAREDCDVKRWRKTSDGALQVIASDGTWDGSGFADDVTKFRKGERLDASFGNIQSFGISGAAFSSGTISGGDLAFRSDGQFASGRWRTTNFAGADIVANNSEERAPRIGRYYLDGHLIAVSAADGSISAMFVTGIRKGDIVSHIYLGGTHYWQSDD